MEGELALIVQEMDEQTNKQSKLEFDEMAPILSKILLQPEFS